MQVEAEVKQQYEEQPDVGRSLVFRKPLHHMLQQSTGVMESWLVEVEMAAKIKQQRKRNLAKSNNSICQYMTKPPQEKECETGTKREVRQRLIDTG